MSTVETPTKERLAEASDETVCAEALAWMNDVRAEYGLEPLGELPRGVPGDAQGCALAAGLKGIADCSSPFPSGGRHSWPGEGASAGLSFSHQGRVVHRPMPPIAAEFMRRFDDGRYPHLQL